MRRTVPKTKDVRESTIPAFDLKRQYEGIKQEIDEAIARVLGKGYFILGEQVERFEEEFAQYAGAKYAVGVGSGTEALHLSLCALEIGTGDEVITVPNTAIATVSAISSTGAKPVFVDIDPKTYTLDTAKIESVITSRTKAVIPVHLYGNVVDMGSLMKIAGKHSLAVIEDACQSHGAEYKGTRVGTIGNIGAFSFYPTKNLGGYGDGGMIVTNDEIIARKAKLLRFYGMTDKDRYIHVIKGINSRLDEIQAAILRVKLKHLDKWNDLRRVKASLYNQLLPTEHIQLPQEPPYAKHVYHLYVIATERRDELRSYLKTHHIDTPIHYPTPIHLQPAYSDLGLGDGSFPTTEKCAKEVLSLPMFPELTEEEIRYTATTVKDFFGIKDEPE